MESNRRCHPVLTSGFQTHKTGHTQASALINHIHEILVYSLWSMVNSSFFIQIYYLLNTSPKFLISHNTKLKLLNIVCKSDHNLLPLCLCSLELVSLDLIDFASAPLGGILTLVKTFCCCNLIWNILRSSNLAYSFRHHCTHPFSHWSRA